MCIFLLRTRVLPVIFGLFLAFFGGGSANAGLFGDDTALKIEQAVAQLPETVDGYVLDLDAIKAFYALRANKPAWDIGIDGDKTALSASLQSLVVFAHNQGIFLDDYPIKLLDALIASNAEADRIKLEIIFSDFILRLAHDLHGDEIDLAPIYPGWSFKREPADIVTGLNNAVEQNKVSAYIASLVPKNKNYLDLVAALRSYRAIAEKGDWAKIGDGLALKPGDKDARVAQMRLRLLAEGYAVAAAGPEVKEHYDASLAAGVKVFQERHGLKGDGHAGTRTIAEMNVSVFKRVEQIIANMERWRHMPEALPPRYVMVNIASTWMEMRENGQAIYADSVIVGRLDRKTPFIRSNIRSVIFNPIWHVPAKIARKDILPKLRKDPHYLEKLGFVINGSAEDPYGASVDWNKIKESEFNFRLRQSPGDMNSLGRLKFDFDNDFAVYMHGTPHEELFDKAERFFSSGCVRLHDPERFAQIVLSRNASVWDAASVHEQVEKGTTRWLKVAEQLPVYFVYWTVFADDNGDLNFRSDIYNYDEFLIENLHEDGAEEARDMHPAADTQPKNGN